MSLKQSFFQTLVGGTSYFLSPKVTRNEEASAISSLPSAIRRSSSSDNGTTSVMQSRNTAKNSKNDGKESIPLLVEIAIRLGIAIATSCLITYLTRRIMKGLLPETDEDTLPSSSSVYNKLQRILTKRQISHDRDDNGAVKNKKATTTPITLPPLSPRELQMADEILDPDEIESSFADIGGLDNVKQEIYELAVLPLIRPELFENSKLVQPVKGILLYGRPGTGKTLLAKALAKESEAIFLPLQLSKILNKYWGESNKLIAATFSLANKLQPAIIFIDELDTFLKNTNSETAFMDTIKAEFLTLWDGVTTSSKTSRVLVLGATNKPQNIDPAILRRMPRAFEVPLPNYDGRVSILNLLLKDENVEKSVLQETIPELAKMTNGYSGSDLKELCKAAAMIPVQERTAEFARRRVMGETNSKDPYYHQQLDTETKLRPISRDDLYNGLQKVKRTGEAAYRYGEKFVREETERENNNNSTTTTRIDLNSLQQLATMLRTLSSLSIDKDNEDSIPNIR